MNDRELDAKVAEKVMGWKRLSIYSWRSPEGHSYLPEFSTDIAAAWLVVEKMDSFEINNDDGKWRVVMYAGNEWCAAEADTAPEAICRAALKAVEEE